MIMYYMKLITYAYMLYPYTQTCTHTDMYTMKPEKWGTLEPIISVLTTKELES